LLVLSEVVATGIKRTQTEPAETGDLDNMLVVCSDESDLKRAVKGGTHDGLLDLAVEGSLGGEQDASVVSDAVADGDVVA
jgi:hypothetical protein